MKINMWKLLIVALVTTAVLVGCKDERNNFMVDDSVSFVNDQVLKSISLYNEKIEVPILKNGKGQQSTTVLLEPSEAALAEYNTANGTNYILMPANCYKLSAEAIKFSEKDTRKLVDVTWKTADIAALDATKDYAIALQLSVANDALQVDKKRSVMLIALKTSTVSMESAQGAILTPAASREVATFDGNIVIDTPVTAMDVTANYSIDNSLIDAYNAANGTNYLPTPNEMVTLAATSSTIAAGQTSTTFTCKVNSAQLFNGNELKAVDNNQYLIPVRISSIAQDGIKLSNSVMYIPFSMNKELKGPWTLLEGENNCYGKDPNAPTWALQYTADKIFDGKLTAGGEWISSFTYAQIQFPMTFVADMGKTQVFTKFLISDYTTHQGNYRDYEIYTAEVYDGANTQWTLVSKGKRDFRWAAVPPPYDFPVQKMVAGRYLKFMIMKPEFDVNAGDFMYGRGKLADVQGLGF